MEETLLYAKKVLLNAWMSRVLFLLFLYGILFISILIKKSSKSDANKPTFSQDRAFKADEVQLSSWHSAITGGAKLLTMYLRRVNNAIKASFRLQISLLLINIFMCSSIVFCPLIQDTLGIINSKKYIKTHDCLVIRQGKTPDNRQGVYCNDGNIFVYLDYLNYLYNIFHIQNKQRQYIMGKVYEIKYLPVTKLIVVSSLETEADKIFDVYGKNDATEN